MEIHNNASIGFDIIRNKLSSSILNSTCDNLSEAVEFSNGMKKVGYISLKFLATTSALFAIFKLAQYVIGTDRKQQILPNFNSDTKQFTATPITKVEESVTPLKDKNGKVIGKTIMTTTTTTAKALPHNVSDLSPVVSGIFSAAILGIAAFATHAFWNTLEYGFQSSSRYLQCNKG
ncbi:MAG: hypothetical protein K2Y01_07475 [Rhabdochlamydiaceae bacterium]|nr:hypothetical protein [Rhabdochlamydiaceae bacterium]